MHTTLQQLIQRVNAAQDFADGLQVMAQEVKAALETQVCSIYLFNRKAKEFILAATDGLNHELIKQVKVAQGEGLVSEVALREEPINLEDSTQHPQYVSVISLALSLLFASSKNSTTCLLVIEYCSDKYFESKLLFKLKKPRKDLADHSESKFLPDFFK